MRLCDAFEGHGYSSKIFSASLLVPMIHSAELRLIVWGDRQPMLRMMVNGLGDLILPFEGTVFKYVSDTVRKFSKMELRTVPIDNDF